MEQKTFTRLFLIVAASALTAAASFNYYADPYFLYHLPHYKLDMLAYDNPVYQSNGAARTFSYDSVIIGSSTSIGFHPEDFDQLFQCRSIQLSVSGACPKDNIHLLDSVFSSSNSVRNVFYGYDVFHLRTNYDGAVFDYSRILSSSKITSAESYLLNMELLAKYSLREKNVSQVQTLDDYNEAYVRTYGSSVDASLYGRNIILDHYQRKTEDGSPAEHEQQIVDMSVLNARQIAEYAGKHSETVFYVYLMPASMYFWDSAQHNHEIDAYIKGLLAFSEILLKTPNVCLYSFLDDSEMTTSYHLYRDYVHHSPELDQEIVHALFSGRDRITADNTEERLHSFQERLQQFDYQSLFH